MPTRNPPSHAERGRTTGLVAPGLSPSAPTRVSPAWSLKAGGVGVGIGAAVISMTGSWVPSYWGDEAASVMSATRDWPSLWRMLGSVDAVHGVYYAALHLWTGMFGTSELATRSLSAIAIGVAAGGMVAIGARLSGLRLGLVAGALCAVLGRLTWAGGETRSYAWVSALVVWAMWAFLTAVQRSSRGHERALRMWMLYAALTSSAIILHIFSAGILFAQAVILLMLCTRARRRRRPILVAWSVSAASALIVASPVILVAVGQRRQVMWIGDGETLSPYILAVSQWFDSIPAAVVGWGALMLAAVLLLLDRGRGSRFERRPGRAGSSHVAWLIGLAWAFIPTALLLTLHLAVPSYVAKYLTYTAPGMALALAAAALHILDHGLEIGWRSHARVLPAACVAIFALASLPSYLAQRAPTAKAGSDWSRVADRVGQCGRPGDGVLFDDGVRPSLRTRSIMRLHPQAFRGLRDLTLRVPFQLSTTWMDLGRSLSRSGLLFAPPHTVWVITPASASALMPDTFSAIEGARAPIGRTSRSTRSAGDGGSTDMRSQVNALRAAGYRLVDTDTDTDTDRRLATSVLRFERAAGHAAGDAVRGSERYSSSTASLSSVELPGPGRPRGQCMTSGVEPPAHSRQGIGA